MPFRQYSVLNFRESLFNFILSLFFFFISAYNINVYRTGKTYQPMDVTPLERTMKDTLKQAVRKILLVIRDIGVSLLGITGWLFHALLAVMTTGFIVGAILCLLIYAKVKPDLDECRELAYDKLAQMERTDFSKLSDPAIYDRDGRQIGLINAGHYQYVGITGISMNIQNAYIAQEDRRFKSHTGVDWIATFRAGLALV